MEIVKNSTDTDQQVFREEILSMTCEFAEKFLGEKINPLDTLEQYQVDYSNNPNKYAGFIAFLTSLQEYKSKGDGGSEKNYYTLHIMPKYDPECNGKNGKNNFFNKNRVPTTFKELAGGIWGYTFFPKEVQTN